MVVTSPVWLFKLIKLNKISVALATLQVQLSHMQPVAPMLGSADLKEVYHHRKFYWTELIWRKIEKSEETSDC